MLVSDFLPQRKRMKKEKERFGFENLPVCAADYIRLVIKKMRWRKKARADVQAELIAHFEDALKNCKTDEEREKTAKELISNFGDAKMLGLLTRRAKKRCRPLWVKAIIKTFQTTGIIICLFSLYVFWFLTGKPQITTDYIAEANKLVRPAAADDSQNAAQFYQKAAKLIETQNKESSECLSKTFSEANETDIVQIRQWLDRNSEALNLIAQGTEKLYYWRTYLPNDPNDNCMLGVLLPNLGEYRKLTGGLRWRAYLSAEDGQYEKAFADLLTAYKLGKHQKSKATLVENLVGMAIESLSMNACRTILSRHKIPADNLASFSNDLQSIVKDEDFTMVDSFEFGKLVIYDEIQRCFTSSRFGVDHLYLKRISGIDVVFFDTNWDGDGSTVGQLSGVFHILFTHPDKQETRLMADAYFDFWKEMVVKTPYELKGRDLEKEVMALIKGNILLEMLAPAMEKISILAWRNKADVEGTLAILAIQRFRQEKGRLPGDLQELVSAGYLSSLPMDPFSDKPLVYKKTENDFTLYSLGQDFDDDGGKMGVGKGSSKPNMWNAEDGDAVFWPVAHPLQKPVTNAR